jgi:predicted transposase/invertase (TIGR01784 family)
MKENIDYDDESLEIPELLPPRMDFVFKEIFGNYKHAEILKSFLQSVLDIPAEDYGEITFIDPTLNREHKDDKKGIVDILITTKSGKTINVELQVDPQDAFAERVIYYSSRLVTRQLRKSEQYGAIDKVICIVITFFDIIKGTSEYHDVFQYRSAKTGAVFSDITEIHTLEMTKLPENADNTELWNWLRFIKAKTKEEFNMIAAASPQMREAVGILAELSADEQNRMLYEARLKAERDRVSREVYVAKKAAAEGRAEGRAEGKIKTAANAVKKYKATLSEAMELAELSGEYRQALIDELTAKGIPCEL